MMYDNVMFMNVFSSGKMNPLTNAGTFVESWADVEESSSFSLGMVVARIPVGEDDSVGE